VDDRINDAMNHFKGKVEQWDIVNEPIHGTVLQNHSGDPNFINSIFTRSRAIDSSVKLGVNDFNILVWNSADDYIARIKSMLAAKVPVDIVGCEGHMGNQLQQDYAANLDKVATLGLPIWITEMDFTAAGNVADEFERLMRTFFGHPKVEGVMMWVWWGGNKWREDLNSNVVNTDFSQTALGDRFLIMGSM
jgi:GH35 family endo-1,4-beta-xylanase